MRPNTVDPRIAIVIKDLIVPALLERLLADREHGTETAPKKAGRVESLGIESRC
jgi:hypothetical protein